MALDTKAKVSLSTFKPKAHGQAAYENKPLVLGLIVGVAFGKSVRQNQEKPDQPFIGLTGNFRVMLGDSVENALKSGNGVQSGVCYLPDAWLDPILYTLEGDKEKGVPGAASVEFAHKVSIEKAENPAGYSWVLTPLKEAAASDPLNAIISSIPVSGALEDKSADKTDAKKTA